MTTGFLGRKVATQCATCRFWQPDEELDETVLGECRMRSPEFRRPHHEPLDAGRVAWLPKGAWRMTESRDWCGEWRE